MEPYLFQSWLFTCNKDCTIGDMKTEIMAHVSLIVMARVNQKGNDKSKSYNNSTRKSDSQKTCKKKQLLYNVNRIVRIHINQLVVMIRVSQKEMTRGDTSNNGRQQWQTYSYIRKYKHVNQVVKKTHTPILEHSYKHSLELTRASSRTAHQPCFILSRSRTQVENTKTTSISRAYRALSQPLTFTYSRPFASLSV